MRAQAPMEDICKNFTAEHNSLSDCSDSLDFDRVAIIIQNQESNPFSPLPFSLRNHLNIGWSSLIRQEWY